jgi:hypothetical protein
MEMLGTSEVRKMDVMPRSDSIGTALQVIQFLKRAHTQGPGLDYSTSVHNRACEHVTTKPLVLFIHHPKNKHNFEHTTINKIKRLKSTEVCWQKE